MNQIALAILILTGQAYAQTPVSANKPQDLRVERLGTYQTGLFDNGGSEIPAYDPLTKRLFVVSAIGVVNVLDIRNPAQPTKLFAIDIKALTGGTPNSVDVKNGMVAVAVEKKDEAGNQLPGLVAFFRSNLATAPTQPEKVVEVGALPDMLIFTPNASKLLVANEGEPGPTADPEGSVSVIDLSAGIAAATVTTARFTAFDGKETELRAKGIRLFLGKKVSEDVEPEYIALSPDGKTAMVTLQEANAFAVLDVATATFRDLLPLGAKDYGRGPAQLKQYNFVEPAIGKKLNGEDILFGGLSGLFFEKEENGKYQFVTVPDRGPNADETPAGRPFLKPDYVAEVIRFELDKASGKISILEKIALKRTEGSTTKAITGFPNIPGVDEKPIDEAGNLLPYDPFGADLEGVVVAPDGSFWMVDEYRPSIYHFNKDGLLLHRYIPKGTAALAGQPEGTYGDETLPAEYAKRRSNRGFEAMALDAQSGILYAFIQTPLANPNRATSDNSNLIRVLGINPTTGLPVAEYLYALEKPLVRATNVDKIGDATYDPQTKSFYVIERDDNAEPTNKKYIFQFNLSGATNLLAANTPALLPGKTMEQHTLDELATLGIRAVKKTKVLNLPSIGYLPGDKPEGLTLLPGGGLAVLNDNDFGLGGPALSTVGLGIITFEPGNTLDASDRDGTINLRNWPVKGLYMPDAVSPLTVNGQTYYLTANEGDTRTENARVSSLKLDPIAFPNAFELQKSAQLGRLNVSTIDGDLDGDGDYDQLYTYGARSFSVWDQYGNLVFDSSDELEKLTAERYPTFFNASNTNNEFDNRSDDKGPEPEGIATGLINGQPYAFIGLERIGGFMVYDVSQPDKPSFVQYVNNRNFEGDPEAGTAGDLGPEGLVFISAKDSPTKQALLVVANEISGTTTIYGISKPQEILGFTLVNAKTGADIRPLTDGDTIDLAQLSNTKLSIRAVVSPDTVGSVVFGLNGNPRYRIENRVPYALGGNKLDESYVPFPFQAGTYTVNATPYERAAGKGKAGLPLTIQFNVVNSARVSRLVLVQAKNAQDITEIKNGDVINLRTLSTPLIYIRADVQPAEVGSVVFRYQVDGKAWAKRIENKTPYAMFGNNFDNSYLAYRLRPGTYQIETTPYSEPNGKGVPGVSSSIGFTIIDPAAVVRLDLKYTGKKYLLAQFRDGDTVRLSALNINPNATLSLRAQTSPQPVEKVVFEIQNFPGFFTETVAPYELTGKLSQIASTLGLGTYTLKVTPFYRVANRLEAGTPLRVYWEVSGSTTAARAQARLAETERSQSAELSVTLATNPVHDRLTIRFNEPVQGEVVVQFLDVLGRKPYPDHQVSLDGQSSLELNVEKLRKALYLVHIRTLQGSTVVRVLKE
jgi:hypothetical protein